MNSKEILSALQAKKISIEDAKLKLNEISRAEGLKTNKDYIISDKNAEHTNNKSEKEECIAIVGMSGRYPGAYNLQDYWTNISSGNNLIKEIPKWRWDVNEYYEESNYKKGKINCKWLGSIENIKCFDPLFFNISPAEAEIMDPQQRLFLQEAYRAFEDSGYNPKALSGTKCGVYLGIMSNEYSTLLHKNNVDDTDILGNNMAIASARIAYFLNLKGPAITIDTACSSSLVATHLAYNQLKNKEIDMALVGGVSLYLIPESYINMCNSGMLSPDGQCKTFDNEANGFVPGEGVGALVLKRLSDAERCNDHIYGVIMGSGINQDGKTNGITAPSMKSQYELIKEIYENNSIDPNSISYVEMHGTGTKLGDPIELQALSNVFIEKTNRKSYCAIGSVKTNLGHTSAAAGVASVQKVLLCFKNKKLVPSINFKNENEHFNFKNSPFYVNTNLKEWEANKIRKAAISSFGFSGTNSHMVIEEYVSKETFERMNTEHTKNNLVLFILSAGSKEQLKAYAKDIKKFIEIKDVNIEDICYTLQVGREPMKYRLGFITESIEDLIWRLSEFIEGNDLSGNFTAVIEHSREDEEMYNIETIIKKLSISVEKRKVLEKLLEAYIDGKNINWEEMYKGINIHRVSLPTYPFLMDEYWIPKNIEKDVCNTKRQPVSIIHSLLHKNTSDFFAQKFTSVFTGKELFLEHHKVNEKKVLPGAVYIEMAIEAIKASLSEEKCRSLGWNGKTLKLKNIIWVEAFTVEDSLKEINIKLNLKDDNNIDYEIYSEDENVINSQGQIEFIEPRNEIFLDIDKLRMECNKKLITNEDIYLTYKNLGIDYGLYQQGIKEIYVGDKKVLAYIVAPELVEKEINAFTLHPSMLDSALQTTIGLIKHITEKNLFIPFAIDEVNILNKFEEKMYVVSTIRDGLEGNEERQKFDIDICNKDGLVCVKIKGLTTRNIYVSSNSIKNDKYSSEDLLSKDTDKFFLDIIESISKGQLSKEELEEIICMKKGVD